MNIIQQKIKTFRFSDRIFDLFLLFLSARGAIVIDRLMHSKSWHALDPQSFHFYTLIIIFFIWLILIQIFESDLVYRRTSVWDIIQNTSLISFIGVTTTISLDFLLKTDLFQRSTILFFGVIAFILLLLKRGGMKIFLSTIRQEGFDTKNIIIIGSQKRAERIIHEFAEHKEYGFRICAILDPKSSRIGEAVDDMVVTGNMSNFKEEIREREIDEVFFAIDLDQVQNVHEIFTYLNTIGVSYHMMINESVHAYADENININPVATSYYGMPMLSFHSVSASYFKLYLKNGIEKAFALFLFFFSLPILLLFSILVKYTSKGPIFDRQERVGLHGRKFFQYKLRSIIINEAEINNQFVHLNKENNLKLTRVGTFMQRYSIDELPQLFNILIGSMTLIGPRPLPVSQVKEFEEDFLHRRHSMKPGLTGLWQVQNDKKIMDLSKWVISDLEYIDNWSFSLDFNIAVKKVSTIISGSGI